MYSINIIPNRITLEAALWRDRILSAGGGFESNSMNIANNFVKLLQHKSYYKKIKYLLPLLGQGINAARIPLIDAFNVGAAVNTSFANSDFNQSSGLQGDGSSKSLNLLVLPSQLGNFVGGLGYWENNINFSGNDSVPMGMYCAVTTTRVQIDMRSASSRFEWGTNTNAAINSSAPTNGNYYAQSTASNSRTLYYNAASTATNTTNDGSSIDSVAISLMGTITNSAGNWAGRCAAAYLTDGTLTANEIIDWDTLLRNYILIPTGKPQ